ncbi:MAG TPA: tetratricopeptide repeat protein [Verrucomicrobiae bacterium]|nr:tetratricopeptide repeat protein [Verrucomicrobiae bacterium]
MKLLLVLLCTLASVVDSSAQTVDQLLKSAQTAPDKKTQANLYKQLGDKLAAQDQIEQAADAFSKALASGRENFSPTERVRMAIHLSWADRLKESRDELDRVLTQDPKNISARSHLARVVSWSGDLSEAVAQADLVLTDQPEHKDALLVKADALQWQGRYVEAIPIYQKLVAQHGDFDARVGLSRSLLAVGNRTAALENRNSLQAGNARQKRELAKLIDALDQEIRPTVEARYNYYRDSDQNRLNRYALAGNFWIDNYKFGINFRHTDANDPTRDNRAEDLLFRIYSRLTDQFGAGAGIGFTQLADRHTSDFLAGHIRFDGKLFVGTAGVNITREVLSDTAELIENRIRMTNVGLYISQPLTERFSVYGGYNYKGFSDGNHANDLQLTTQYAIYLAPKIMIGHRFRLLDFHKQSGSGFFDPNNYIANRAFTSVYYENKLLYTYLEGYVGYQTFRRNQVATDSFIHGGAGSVGIKPIANLAIEVNVEGGNFAAGSTAGFNYLIVGPRVLYRF